jgi:hypothetical protein
VPVGSTVVAAGQAWLVGYHFCNFGGTECTITINNTAVDSLLSLLIPAGVTMSGEWPFRPVLGVKWLTDGVALVGHLWGYI